MKQILPFLACVFLLTFVWVGCKDRPGSSIVFVVEDSLAHVVDTVIKEVKFREVVLEKELLYDQYTLADTFEYKDTFRVFQWDKVRHFLVLIDSIQEKPATWGVLQNRKNKNGEAPLVGSFLRNDYNRMSDTFGIERYQGIPLYVSVDSVVPERYGLDGMLVRIEPESDSVIVRISTIHFSGEWITPVKYVRQLADTVAFRHVVFVDRTNQTIAAVEKSDDKWLIRSMNPATTGRHQPPLMQETPLGIFVIQEKKVEMVFLKDYSTETGGFAPYASRFCNGGYIHGVPVNLPRTTLIEYSASLGTTPRSHMCVRNASSHSKFIYNWVPVWAGLVVVIE